MAHLIGPCINMFTINNDDDDNNNNNDDDDDDDNDRVFIWHFIILFLRALQLKKSKHIYYNTIRWCFL